MSVELSSLRVDEEVYADLRWYFSCLESEFGIKSNFGAMVSAIGGTSNQNKTTVGLGDGENVHVRSGRHTYDSSDGFHDAAIGKLGSVAKERRILAGLKDLTKKQYKTLEAIYEPRQYGNMLIETFGQLAGLACASAPARKAYSKASTRKTWGLREWLDDQCRIAAIRWTEQKDCPELDLVHDIRLGVEADAIDAHMAYASFRRLPPRKGTSC